MAEKPTIVFVPGAWHPHAAFDPLLPSLHREGYATTAVSLPSFGCSPSLPSCDADNVATRNVVEGLVDLGKEVVVVSHSYGGIAINDALDGLGKKEREAQNLLGGVIRLIYVAAMVPSKGQTGQEAMGIVKSREEGGPILETRDSEDGTNVALNATAAFYHDVAPEMAHFYERQLRSHSKGVYGSVTRFEPYRIIPAAYLYCENDKALHIETQHFMVTKAGITVTESFKTSHSPFLSRPEDTVGFIRRMIEDYPDATTAHPTGNL